MRATLLPPVPPGSGLAVTAPAPGRTGAPALVPILVLLLVLMLAGCAPAGDDRRAVFAVFGTEVEVQLRETSEADAALVFGDIGRMLQAMHHELHPWEAGALTELNAALAAGRAHKAGDDIVELIRASQRLEAASQGTFNPAIGQLVGLWGFHTSNYPITDPPPPDRRIDELVAASPSALDLTLDGAIVETVNLAVQLDFSGIAKGLAVKRACRLVGAHGIASAMVNAGGDVMVCGAGSGDRPWRVAIRGDRAAVLETLEIDRPMAVFTSGNYYRFGEFDGTRYAHILDPATGRPVDEVIQATVVHADPLLADAGATALVVAGTSRWRQVARGLGIDRAVVIDQAGNVERIRD
ncbi:MAG: FAD:protein FMN transferase [Wenzhouxiangellaceae bacterium]|nr:FAD:protein FMN transferase [Wenzhouxiangellaceae bacterium]